MAWNTLMTRLGYSCWVANGGDWGAGVATLPGQMRPRALAGIHLNLPILFRPSMEGEPSPAEQPAAFVRELQTCFALLR